MMRQIDIPPLWLALALGLAWGLGRVWSVSGLAWVGAGVVLVGAAMMAAAVVAMVLARTTFVPRRDPEALVTAGLFGISRNPIYLADALILLGHRFDANSVPASGRLAAVARFGVGYDTVDVPACTASGTASPA